MNYNLLVVGVLMLLAYFAGYKFGWHNGHEDGHRHAEEENSYGRPIDE